MWLFISPRTISLGFKRGYDIELYDFKYLFIEIVNRFLKYNIVNPMHIGWHLPVQS